MIPALLVYCTFPSLELAEDAATKVVEGYFAACATTSGPVRSVYRWQGKLCSDEEYRLTMKTTAKRFEALKEHLLAHHPYDCPEIVAVEVKDGHADYLQWIKEATQPPSAP